MLCAMAGSEVLQVVDNWNTLGFRSPEKILLDRVRAENVSYSLMAKATELDTLLTY